MTYRRWQWEEICFVCRHTHGHDLSEGVRLFPVVLRWLVWADRHKSQHRLVMRRIKHTFLWRFVCTHVLQCAVDYRLAAPRPTYNNMYTVCDAVCYLTRNYCCRRLLVVLRFLVFTMFLHWWMTPIGYIMLLWKCSLGYWLLLLVFWVAVQS